MKKFFAVFVMIVSIMFTSVSMYAGGKDYEKLMKKEKKEKMKEYKKGGWELFGSSRTLEVVLYKHYDMLEASGEDAYEVVGTATRCKSKNVGKQMAVNNAYITYAQQAGTSLKGRVLSDMSGDGTEGIAEFDHFYGAYERQVAKEIKGELKESYTIIRPNGDGTYEMMVFFVVSESAAAKARMRAMENAMAESKLAQEHAAKISEFIKAGFEN